MFTETLERLDLANLPRVEDSGGVFPEAELLSLTDCQLCT